MAIAFYDRRESLARAHRHFDMQRFVAAPGAHAAHRRRGEVVAADGEAAMALAREHAMRDVHAHPAFAFDPDVGPGMACGFLVVSGIDVAADIARRNAPRAAAGDEEVRMVLAHGAAVLVTSVIPLWYSTVPQIAPARPRKSSARAFCRKWLAAKARTVSSASVSGVATLNTSGDRSESPESGPKFPRPPCGASISTVPVTRTRIESCGAESTRVCVTFP